MKIIIVEDEIRIREGIQNLIRKIGDHYEVIGEADNGQAGLEIIKNLKPDLVITDIKMPVMDGLEMLRELAKDKCTTKAIVLSAYSEFSYAQEAIKLGVNEYLIKPITIGDFAQSLKNIENQLERENYTRPIHISSVDDIFSSIMLGGIEVNEELKQYLKVNHNIQDTTSIAQITIYLGKNYRIKKSEVKSKFVHILSEKPQIRYSILECEKDSMIVILAYGFNQIKEIERWFQNRILLQQRGITKIPISYGFIEVNGLENLTSGYQILLQYMDWNIVLGDEVMVTYPEITYVQTALCTYPIEIENKMKIALCAYDAKAVKQITKQFESYFRGCSLYSPKEIKESYVRFLWMIINLVKEIGSMNYPYIEQQKLLETIMQAKNYIELMEVLEQLLDKTILNEKQMQDEVMSLVVKKAKSMIHEFYQSGISLDEIASKLNITPEYLGSQFHKEVGTNFTSYVKQYRINKAKELLIGTQLKLYKIAEKVGYNDAKYFSQVFRELTGQLPADYRKAQK